MATQTTDPATGNTTTERSFRVEFELPRSGYSVRVHREAVITDKAGNELAVVTKAFAFDEPIGKVVSMQAMIDLAARCGMEPMQLVAALADTFDKLVAERRAEVAAKAAADAQAKADAQG